MAAEKLEAGRAGCCKGAADKCFYAANNPWRHNSDLLETVFSMGSEAPEKRGSPHHYKFSKSVHRFAIFTRLSTVSMYVII
jgi:hypothetical protein